MLGRMMERARRKEAERRTGCSAWLGVGGGALCLSRDGRLLVFRMERGLDIQVVDGPEGAHVSFGARPEKLAVGNREEGEAVVSIIRRALSDRIASGKSPWRRVGLALMILAAGVVMGSELLLAWSGVHIERLLASTGRTVVAAKGPGLAAGGPGMPPLPATPNGGHDGDATMRRLIEAIQRHQAESAPPPGPVSGN